MSLLNGLWSHQVIKRQGTAAAARDVYTFSEFVNALRCFDLQLALEIVDDNVDALAIYFAQHPLETYEALTDVLWFTLSFDMGLGIVRAPNATQRRLARQLCKRIDATACARLIERGRLRDLERWARFLFFLKRADKHRAQKIIKQVALDKLDVWLEPFWEKPPIDLEHFVMTLALAPDWEPSRSWIERHRTELSEVPPRFAILAPDACAEAMRKGAHLAYPQSLGLAWEELMAALACLAKVDRDIAARSLRQEVDTVAKSLTTHQAN